MQTTFKGDCKEFNNVPVHMASQTYSCDFLNLPALKLANTHLCSFQRQSLIETWRETMTKREIIMFPRGDEHRMCAVTAHTSEPSLQAPRFLSQDASHQH